MNPKLISQLIIEDVSDNNGNLSIATLTDFTQFIYDKLFSSKVVCEDLYGISINKEDEHMFKRVIMNFTENLSEQLKGKKPDQKSIKDTLIKVLSKTRPVEPDPDGIELEKPRRGGPQFKTSTKDMYTILRDEIVGKDDLDKWLNDVSATILKHWEMLIPPPEVNQEYEKMSPIEQDKASTALTRRLHGIPRVKKAPMA